MNQRWVRTFVIGALSLLSTLGAGLAAGTAAASPPIDTSGPVDLDPWLGVNPAFVEVGVGIAPVDCALPAWSLDPAAVEAVYQAFIVCHDEAWRSTLAHFGIELESPNLWAGAKTAAYDGACGSNTFGREAFYCDVDQTLVMPFDTMLPIAEYGPGYALAVLSHEYGHHLQEQMGILPAYGARRQAAGWDSETGQLLSRQLELQAWCLSGMFYGVNNGRGSIDQTLTDQAVDNNSHAGDRPGELREHGTNENIANWFGWGSHPSLEPGADVVPTLYECNPWAARDAAWLE